MNPEKADQSSLEQGVADFVKQYLVENLPDEPEGYRRQVINFLLSKPELLKQRLGDCFGVQLSESVLTPCPWLVVEVGEAKNGRVLLDEDPKIKAHRAFFNKPKEDHLEWRVEKERRKIGLICLAGTSLGFTEKVSYTDLCERAKLLGFKQCPDETPFCLARQHREAVIINKRVFFATRPILFNAVGYASQSHMMQGMFYGGTPYHQDGWRRPILVVDRLQEKFELRVGLEECKPDHPLSPQKVYVFECPIPNE